jgi:hypothetical protein
VRGRARLYASASVGQPDRTGSGARGGWHSSECLQQCHHVNVVMDLPAELQSESGEAPSYHEGAGAVNLSAKS